MFELFYQHPFIVGTVVTIIAAIELGFLVFGFEAYKTFFRRRRWMHLLFQESESRSVLISSAVLFLVIGLAIIAADKGLMPRPFCSAACTVALVNFLAMIVNDRRRRQSRTSEEIG